MRPNHPGLCVPKGSHPFVWTCLKASANCTWMPGSPCRPRTQGSLRSARLANRIQFSPPPTPQSCPAAGLTPSPLGGQVFAVITSKSVETRTWREHSPIKSWHHVLGRLISQAVKCYIMAPREMGGPWRSGRWNPLHAPTNGSYQSLAIPVVFQI